ncbi:membrane protein [Desulfosporosinus sp. Tol-M]|jgi:Na+/H+ antiporter NhaD and related arsenite permeases|nr:membrane protein [Desulfosporosinus sp. Tol-M]
MIWEEHSLISFWLSIIIFVITYIFIITDKIHRTIVVWMGAVLVIVLGVINQEKAIEHIDFNTLLLLIGMMVIVGITRKSGVFEYLAIKSAKMVKGEPVAILVALGFITAVASALLDNVTAVLLVVPITYALTDLLEIAPIPFLFTEIITSNIGGTATLIGDPPNIMIGSATGLGFMDFIMNLALPVGIILVTTIVCLVFIYKKDLTADKDKIERLMALNEIDCIREWLILKKSLVVLGLTILGFLLHQSLHLESATIALFGAGLLMLITREEPEEALLSIEWPTIFFFAGLFILVGGLQVNGVISLIANISLQITGDSVALTGILVLWLSALASAFVDNIPFVATMIPLLQEVGQLSQMPMESIWWSLALGACLGGNGSLIGASANVIVAGIAERNGTPIKFKEFLIVGFPLMLLSIIISTGYLYLVFWR